jgi:hypothetical protein
VRVARAANRTVDIAARVDAMTSTSRDASEAAGQTQRAAEDLVATAAGLRTVVAGFRVE